jgi:hypothetical protein
MLECVDSYEISEWMAYERAFGPLTGEYRDRALSAIYDQLLLANRMFGAVNFEDNPVPEDMPRLPHVDEVYRLKEDIEED